MQIRTRLSLILMTILILDLVLLASVWHGGEQIRGYWERYHWCHQELVSMHRMAYAVTHHVESLREFVLLKDTDHKQEYETAALHTRQAFHVLQEYTREEGGYVAPEDEEEEEEEERRIRKIEKLVQQLEAESQAVLWHHEHGESEKALAALHILDETLVHASLIPLLRDWIEEESKEIEKNTAIMDNLAWQQYFTVFAVLLLMLLLVSILGIAHLRRLRYGLDALLAGVERIGGGDLATPIVVEGTDEISLLANGFNQMVTQLQETMVSRDSVAQSEARLRLLGEHAYAILLELDRAGAIHTAGEGLSQALGWDRAETQGQALLDRIHPDDRNNFRESFTFLLRDTKGTASCAFRVQDQAGTWRWFECVITHAPGGERLLLAARDIGARKAAERALLRSEKLAAVGTLAAGIAHEFNNLHTPLIGYLELMLETETFSARGREQIATMLKAARRASDITQNLLEFTRNNPGETTPTDLLPLVQDVTRLLERELELDSVKLTVTLDPAPAVRVNRGAIAQVLLNMLINARHAVLENHTAHIHIQTGGDAEHAWIKIRDNGCGIPPEKIPHLFTPFHSGKGAFAPAGTAQQAIQGTGLGLSLCHTLVDAHGGRIDVESKVGVGTTFTIRLPITRDPLEEDPEGDQTLSPQTGQRILLVDDDADVRTYVFTLLGKYGLTVDLCETATDALRLLESKTYDAAVLDIQMPRTTGLELLEKMNARLGEECPPVIIITGWATPETTEHCKQCGAAAVIRKPFNGRTLLGALNKAWRAPT